MLKTSKFAETVTKNVSVTCDCCDKEYFFDDDILEIEEFLSISKKTGYSSVLGDGRFWTLDLCQRCAKTLLGPFMKFTESA